MDLQIRTVMQRIALKCISVLTFSLIFATQVSALTFDWDAFGGITGSLNTSVQLAAQWRIEERSDDLVGKANLNPDLCPVAPNGAGTSCQGHLDYVNPLHEALNLNSTIGEGIGANQVAANAPGQWSNNNDDGNLNFDRGDVTQAVARITSDLQLDWKDFTFFTRGYFFYDNENYGRAVFHPNVGTEKTVARTGLRRGFKGDPVFIAQNGPVRDQIGMDFQLLDASLAGYVPFFGDRELSFKIGRQPINWGESTLLIVNSLNTFNTPNVNNLFRPAFLDLAEVLTPIGAISLSTDVTESTAAEVFYQYDWDPVEIPPPGSYLSTVDVGSDNTADKVFLGFGKTAENHFRIGIADQIMLSAVTDTHGAPELLPEKRAERGGQYGLAFRHYAEWLNDGTELAFYAANYHSRLPYVSTFAGEYSCLNGPGAPDPAALGPLKDVLDVATVLGACPGADAALVVESALPAAVAPPVRDQNIGENGSAFVAETIKFRLEYPEDIQVYGVSFNTTFGDLSMQGEVAYRPDAPLQVDDIDLAFAALQNTFPRGNGAGDETDRFDIGVPGVGTVAQLPGARYALPDFVSAYRGRDPLSYAPGERIQGWQEFDTFQYNLGGTYIIGPKNWVFADQIIIFGEIGATHVPDMPDQDVLQIEGPGTFTHASAGTDGTGADGSRQSNSGVIGPSGIRFNPTQEEDGFADDFSWGYRLIGIFRYPNVFPGISLEPTLIWAHDVRGTAPGPGENFIEGRKNFIANIETRYGQSWSTTFGYIGFYGAGRYNLLRDRDFVQFGVRYRF